jgi:aarF domain-containing kinase
MRLGTTLALALTSPLQRLPSTLQRAPLHAVRAVASSPPSSPSLPPLPSPVDLLQRLTSKEAFELRRELLELAIEQDLQVVFRRSIDLARAVRTVGGEAAVAAVNNNASAPLLLRRLCEELGATYVKLGQFIASSPTLFPPEYVQEFQKTLDQTPPMPWSVVKPLIEEELGKPLEQACAAAEPPRSRRGAAAEPQSG